MTARPGFAFDPGFLRRLLLENAYRELSITGAHALAVRALPPVHADPFDRLLLGQAESEAVTLLTADRVFLSYPGPILFSAAR